MSMSAVNAKGVAMTVKESEARTILVSLYSDCTGLLLGVPLAENILAMIMIPPGCHASEVPQDPSISVTLR